MTGLAAVTPDELWGRWALDPLVLFTVAAAGAAYATGYRHLRRTAGPGRVVSPAQGWSFAAGLVLVLVALVSPLDALSEALFSAHMGQHLLLGLLAPLLLVAGAPVTVTAWALAPDRRRRWLHAGRRALGPLHTGRSSVGLALVAIGLHTVAWWAWHLPSLYDAAVDHSWVHVLEHETLLASGLLFWWVIVAVRWRERSGVAVLYLFVAGLAGGALAALLTLAPDPLYPVHAATTAAWDLSPLEDQQLAGGIMWVPGGLVYVVAAVVGFVRWLEAGDRRARARPAHPPAAGATVVREPVG